MTARVRDAETGDAGTITEFNRLMALETEGKALNPEIVGAGVERLLRNPADGRYRVAGHDGRVVGQLLVTYEWSDWRNGRFWWIQSVYVHADFRRQGVFAALYRHVESCARADEDACGLRLYVEKDNRRAQDTYVALGMSFPGYLVMEAGFPRQGD